MNVTAFISYAHADEKALNELHKHLAMLRREGTLKAWNDHQVVPSEKLHDVIAAKLAESRVFLALVSPDYLSSNYCYEKEFTEALRLSEAGKMRIVPIILEPCDWLNSPLKDFAGLPKDGQAISTFTNANVAYLGVVTGLRSLIADMIEKLAITSSIGSVMSKPTSGRRLRIKQDFDSIQRAEYADQAFSTIRSYFETSCAELNQLGLEVRAKFENMDSTAFTCTVVNRAKVRGGEAHITFHNSKSRHMGFGDISYVNQPHAEKGTSNGWIGIEHDDYELYLTMGGLMASAHGDEKRATPKQAAEKLWNEFVNRVGIEYE